MAGLGNSVESSILQLIFNATTWANVAINATASPLTNLFVALHTADPGEAGTQSTNEIAYTSYARVAIARTAGGWTISGTIPTIVSNAVAVTFPTCTGLTPTALYWSIGTLTSGAGVIICSGPLSSSPVGVFTADQSNERIQIKSHALALDDRIGFFQLGGLVLPTGITEGIAYFVGTIVDADTITVSTTAGNANPVNITVNGQGLAYKLLPFNISTGVTPSFAIGALQCALD
jgi:hypothetical protein